MTRGEPPAPFPDRRLGLVALVVAIGFLALGETRAVSGFGLRERADSARYALLVRRPHSGNERPPPPGDHPLIEVRSRGRWGIRIYDREGTGDELAVIDAESLEAAARTLDRRPQMPEPRSSSGPEHSGPRKKKPRS
jgi:hypothetical protein